MTTLYRLYDSHGDLLYVGIADNWPVRMKQHQADKAWWGEVASTKFDHFTDRASAEAAEREAIRQGEPRFNIIHNAWATRGQAHTVELNGKTNGILKIGEVAALGLDDGSCPVGYVSALTPDWVTLELYSWLSEQFGFRQEIIAMRTILKIAKAPKMTTDEKREAGYGSTTDTVFAMDEVGAFQTRWEKDHKVTA